MLRALVLLFVAMAVFEIAAVAMGKANLMGGLVIIGLALFFAGTLHALGGIQRDVRALLAQLRGPAERAGEQGPQR